MSWLSSRCWRSISTHIAVKMGLERNSKVLHGQRRIGTLWPQNTPSFLESTARANTASRSPHGTCLPRDQNQNRPSLPPEFTSVLLQTAITLHDRQMSKAERFKALWPSFIAGGAGHSLWRNRGLRYRIPDASCANKSLCKCTWNYMGSSLRYYERPILLGGLRTKAGFNATSILAGLQHTPLRLQESKQEGV
jgi:hypothetical protein